MITFLIKAGGKLITLARSAPFLELTKRCMLMNAFLNYLIFVPLFGCDTTTKITGN